MRHGVRLGIDVGSVRVGVAVSDPSGLIATPVTTLPRATEEDTDVSRVAAMVAEREALEVVVGLPRSLDGTEGRAAATARAWAKALHTRLQGVPVRLVDERLTTVDAHRALREAGRRERSSRSVIDQQAAVLILQVALDSERNTGKPAGDVVGGRKPRHRRTKPTSEGQHE